jgi:site-specific DNA recombinase
VTNVAVYVRVSTDRQAAHDVSIPSQLELLHGYCRDRGWTVAQEFVEPGKSAMTDARPMFQRMVEAAFSDEHPFDVILVHSYSRLFRSVDDSMHYLREFKASKVKCVSMTQEADNQTQMGKMIHFLYAWSDENNSLETSKHTKRTMRANAKAGFFNGSAAPFGYRVVETDLPGRSGKKKKLAINEDEAAIVRKIFALAESGASGGPMGIKRIAENLNDSLMLRRGAKWTTATVHFVLRDRAYVGEYHFGARTKASRESGEAPVVIKTDAIIDKDRFERMAVTRKARAPTQTPPTHVTPTGPMSGLVKCGECGGSLMLSSGNGNGGRYRYYKCKTRLKQHINDCACPNIPADELETLILNAVLDRVLEPENTKAILGDCIANSEEFRTKEVDQRREVDQALRSVNIKLSNLLNAVEGGLLTQDSTIADRIRALQQQKDELTVKQSDLRVSVAVPRTLLTELTMDEFTAKMRAQLADPSSESARQLLRLLVQQITIYPEKATMRGPNLRVAEAAILHRSNGQTPVPTFIHKWRARKDSNLRPPSS